MRLTVIDSISHPAKTVNEDLFDHNDQAAWIFDGATGIAKDTIPDAASDPQWLVQTLNAELKRVWDNKLPTPVLLQRATQNTIDRYEQLLGDAAPPLVERPTACLTFARLWQGQLEISTVGDAGILYEKDGQVETMGFLAYPSAQKIREERQRLLAAGTPPDQLLEIMLPMHYEFRSNANVDGGYDIVDTTPRWVNRMSIKTVLAQTGKRFLLMTDGFYRLIDVFGKYDPATLIEAANTAGLSGLYEQLRNLEADDETCTQFARQKSSDDVAAALISIS